MTLALDITSERWNLTIQQGAPLKPVVAEMVNPDETPVDLTGCGIRGEIKKNPSDKHPICEFTTAIIDAANGIYSFGLSREATSKLRAGDTPRHPMSVYVWDLFLIDSLGDPLPLYHGEVHVLRTVTDV